MAKHKSTTVRPREERGGYPAGDKLVSELKPPPGTEILTKGDRPDAQKRS
jgi:hypothetical protein